jgi:uncharacterized protein (DUF697 family)
VKASTRGEAEYTREAEYAGEAEYYGEAEYPGEYVGEGPLGQALELEFTAELLEVASEADLDHFLGKLFRKVSQGLGKVISGPAGSALGGLLKGVAKQYLPVVGGALGSLIAPGIGTAAGSALASAAGQAFGLEMEGPSDEDRDFEIARNYVRLASAAAEEAATAPPAAPPQAVAQRAMTVAAQSYAPGRLGGEAVRSAGAPSANGVARPRLDDRAIMPHHWARTGRWIRRGPHIMLIGVYRRSVART